MKLHTYRRGFATNSSSSHSVVFFKKGDARFHDELVDQASFQWDHFTAASESAKRDYLSLTLAGALRERFPGLDDQALQAIARTYMACTLPGGNSGIDHQSGMDLPRVRKGKMPDRCFFEELAQAVLRPDVAILGGDDGSEHPLAEVSRQAVWHKRMPKDRHQPDWVCRNDGYWVLLDTRNGTKIRLSFDEEREAPTRSYLPELVDVNITNWCNRRCGFCYRNCTIKGRHAEHLDDLARELGRMEVLEVVVGGGDVLSHPRLPQFLWQLGWQDICVSLTVRDLRWLKNTKLRESVLPHVSALGVSVHSLEELNAAFKQVDAHGLRFSRQTGKQPAVVFQHIFGLLTQAQTTRLVKSVLNNGCELTLLGWKPTGRALPNPPHRLNLRKLVDDVNCWYMGMDARLVDLYRGDLEGIAFPETWADAKDGAFSMYIDAVDMTAGINSWAPASERLPLQLHEGHSVFMDLQKMAGLI